MTGDPAPARLGKPLLSLGDPAPTPTLRVLAETDAGPEPAAALDRALEALTEAARSLVRADGTALVVWDEGRRLGTIRAAAGDAAAHVGATVGPDSGPFETPLPAGPPLRVQTAALASTIGAFAATAVVPLHGFVNGPLVLCAGWREPQAPDALARANESLRTLARLTSLASVAESEHARTREEASLQAVLESVGDGVWIETDGEATVNPAARALLGLRDGESVRDLDRELRQLDGRPVTPDEHPRARAIATRAPVPFLHRRTRRDGEERVFAGTAAPVFGPLRADPLGTVVTFRDVTEEYNRTLLTERFLEQLFEALPLGVGVADPSTGEVLSVNQAYADLVGWTPDEMVGEVPPYPWWDDMPALERFVRGHDASPRHCLFRRRDGMLVPVELVPLLVSEAGGTPAAAVALITDLSERRRFEQQIVQSGKLAAIGELAAGVAHEINNPLFAILGLVEFLLKEVEPGTKAHDRLLLVQQTGLEIKEVVRALLDFARERSDEFELVSLREVLEQTVDLVRRTTLRKEIELVERYPEEPLAVHASAGQLKQVVLNLVTNAQQAMRDGGTITLEVELEVERDAADALVRIRDTGPGIPEDVIDRIFDPFFTTKRELGGTGLGLPLSQSIADGHGGTLAAASPPGEGAEFTLRLPLARRALA